MHSGSAFVSYREYMVLRLPVAATTLAPSRPVISTKLTPDAIKELLTIAEDCDPSMPFQPNEIWKRLLPELQRQISDELSMILQEVLYEQIPAW